MIFAVAICALAAFGAAVSAPAQTLTNFRPSALRTEYGVSSDVEFSTGLVELEPGSLAHHLPQAMKNFQFAERVWVIGYKTTILDAGGKPPRENYLCHTFFADQRVTQHDE